MEITKSNFLEEYDNIIQAIKEADFLAIDGEFTGLCTSQKESAAPFDTPSERYKKNRMGASDFLLMQYGICTFKANEEKTKYEARPYNFYLFPRQFSRSSPDRRFLCQSSSIDFLVSHSFDFNKVFREGVPYLTFDQEARLTLELERKHASSRILSTSLLTSPNGAGAKQTAVAVPDDQKAFLQDVCDKISKFLETKGEAEPLVIPPCNGFQRKLIYQTVEEKHPLAHVETKTGEKRERYIVVTKAKDTDEAKQQELQKQEFERMELDHQVGFSKVMREIAASGKIVVGHNMILDVIHSMTHFFYPLPQELDEFKMVVKSVLPKIVDTKLMANTNPLKDHFLGTTLEELIQTLKYPPFKPVQIDIAEGFQNYADGGVFHEAGYDAFVTGSCFASMNKFLGNLQDPSAQLLLSTSSLVEPFVNKMFLFRVSDIPYINLDGPDLEGERDHVFHVTFPREWRTSDLYQLFQPYGNVQVSWLTDTTAYVALFRKENAKQALDALSGECSLFRVVSFAAHHQSKVGRSAVTAPPLCVKTDAVSTGTKRKASGEEEACPPAKSGKSSLIDVRNTSSHKQQQIETGKTTSIMAASENNEKQVPQEVGKETKKEKKLFEESDAW